MLSPVTKGMSLSKGTITGIYYNRLYGIDDFTSILNLGKEREKEENSAKFGEAFDCPGVNAWMPGVEVRKWERSSRQGSTTLAHPGLLRPHMGPLSPSQYPLLLLAASDPPRPPVSSLTY